MASFIGQLRQVARRLSRARMFTIITLITLAVGIGANTAIFSVVRGVLLKPLPFPDADRLVGVWETAPGINIPEINASPAEHSSLIDRITVDPGVRFSGGTKPKVGRASWPSRGRPRPAPWATRDRQSRAFALLPFRWSSCQKIAERG